MDGREEYADYGGLVPSPSYRSSMSGYASQYTGETELCVENEILQQIIEFVLNVK